MNRLTTRSPEPRRRIGTAGATTLVLLLLTGTLTACGSSDAPDSPDGTKPAAAGPNSGPRTTYPTQAENCGRTVKVDHAPQRIVSFFPSNTELLLRLGLKDRIAGQTWTNQSAPKPVYADAFKSVKVLAPGEVSREVLLAARPDFILADGEYQFDGTKLPTINELARLGIPVYIDSAFCPAATGTATLDATTADLTALGNLLDARGPASAAAAETRDRLAAVDKAVAARPPTPVAMVQIVDKQLYALTGGLYSDILRRAGGNDQMTGTVPPDANFGPVSTEILTKRNPTVVIYNYTDETDRAASEQWLRTHLAATDAVRTNRLVAIPAADFSELRAVDGTADLAKALHPDAF